MYVNEKYSANPMDVSSAQCKDVYDDSRDTRPIATGEVFDTIINPLTGERKLVGHYFNLVVDTCSIVIAGLMKGTLSPVQYLAVGSGSSSWLNENPPTPLKTDTTLLNEVYRKEINLSDVVFLDSDNYVTTTPTNKIQVSVVFLELEANGELREFGIFGGNATGAKDSGLMINRKIHPLIYKTSGMQLERTIRLTF